MWMLSERCPQGRAPPMQLLNGLKQGEQPFERGHYTLPANRFARALKRECAADVLLLRHPGAADCADRLLRRSAARPCNAADSDGTVGLRAEQRAMRHFLDNRFAHGAVRGERGGLHAQHALLGEVCIRNESGFEPGGATRYAGDRLG